MILNMHVQQASQIMTRGAETEQTLNVQVTLVAGGNRDVDIMSSLTFTLHDPLTFDVFKAGNTVVVTIEPVPVAP